MASGESPPPRAAATPAAAAKPAARSCHCNTRCGCNTRCCNTFYRAKITPLQGVGFFWAASHDTAPADLISGSTLTYMKVNIAASFGDKMSPVWAYFTRLHRPFRPREDSGQERHAACVAKIAKSVVCTPITRNAIKALIRHLHKASYHSIHLRRFARNAPYKRSCFGRMMTQPHSKGRRYCKSTPHLMGHGAGRPGKTSRRRRRHGGRRGSSSSSTPHIIGSGPGRPVKANGPPHGPGGSAHV